jgi:hypothetical protein
MANAGEMRQRHSDLLIDRIKESRYPSRELMDRAELSLRSRDAALTYVDVLFDKVKGKYPSLELLDRIDAVLRLLEASEEASEQRSEEETFEDEGDNQREMERSAS